MLQIPSRCGLLNVSIGPESVERWLDLSLRQTTRYRAEERGYYTLVCRARNGPLPDGRESSRNNCDAHEVEGARWMLAGTFIPGIS